MDFWLVQRMNRGLMHEGPISTPEHLQADYMGSAEFEFGAVPKAFMSMKAQHLTQRAITVNAFETETVLYVVAPVEQVSSLQQRFQAWFDGGLRSKENPYLDRVITRKGWRRGETMSDEDFARLPIAWWALKEKIFFSTEESIAKMWLDAMGASEAALPEAGPMNIF